MMKKKHQTSTRLIQRVLQLILISLGILKKQTTNLVKSDFWKGDNFNMASVMVAGCLK